MFGWLQKRDRPPIATQFQTDIHSHLLPGVDDGAKELSESLSLIEKMVSLGYEQLIITPHVMADAYPNSAVGLKEHFIVLQRACEATNIDVKLGLSAEYYLDEGFLPLLESGEILSFGKSNYLLFETSYMAKPNTMLDMIYQMKLAGYKPVMAHPERYRYVKDLEKEYGALRELEVLFQIDATSLGGFYGKDACKKAHFLLEKGWIDFVGSDTHKMRHLEQLEEIFAQHKIWNRLFRLNTILNITL